MRSLPRVLGLVVLALLVAAAAAQPAVRDASGTSACGRTRSSTSRSTSAARCWPSSSPGGVARFERARSLGRRIHVALHDVPTGVATLTNRMMPLLFPTGDERGVTAVLDHSLTIMQPPPVPLSAARASQLGALTLAADRSYFDPDSSKRVLVVFSDFDTDFFSAVGTLRLLRRHHIEPFLIRTAAPREQIFDARGLPEPYASVSTVSVHSLRSAGLHAYEEGQTDQAIAAIRSYLGRGTTRPSGIVEGQHSLAGLTALGALLLVLALAAPSINVGLRRRSRTSSRS